MMPRLLDVYSGFARPIDESMLAQVIETTGHTEKNNSLLKTAHKQLFTSYLNLLIGCFKIIRADPAKYHT